MRRLLALRVALVSVNSSFCAVSVSSRALERIVRPTAAVVDLLRPVRDVRLLKEIHRARLVDGAQCSKFKTALHLCPALPTRRSMATLDFFHQRREVINADWLIHFHHQTRVSSSSLHCGELVHKNSMAMERAAYLAVPSTSANGRTQY